mgnify:CR=1 FL=1
MVCDKRRWVRVALTTVAVVALTGCPPISPPDSDPPSDGEPTDESPPAQVDGLTATAADAEVTLNWTDPADRDLDRIEVTWDPDGQTAQTVTPGTQGFTATGLTNDISYTFSVVALNKANNASVPAEIVATPEARYFVTYLADSADAGSVPVDDVGYVADETVTVIGNTGSLTKSDHTFVGWSTEPDGGGTIFDPGETFPMPTGGQMLYAVWNPSGTVEILFDNPDDPTIVFSGGSSPIDQGSMLTVTVEGAYTGHEWFLNSHPPASHQGLGTNGAEANIDTSQLGLGVHTLHVFVAEGYSASIAFEVVDGQGGGQ